MEVILADKTGARGKPVKAIAWYGGLAVTPTWWAVDYDLDQWSVTHVESGSLIWGGITECEAIRLMAALCERLDVDWTESFERLTTRRETDPLLYQRVKRIIRGICE